MRKDDWQKYCKSSGKYCYSSEAKARRALNRYDDIKRVYLCDSCDSWHTTSMGVGLALQEGIITNPTRAEKRRKKKGYSQTTIQQRINELKKNIKKVNKND